MDSYEEITGDVIEDPDDEKPPASEGRLSGDDQENLGQPYRIFYTTDDVPPRQFSMVFSSMESAQYWVNLLKTPDIQIEHTCHDHRKIKVGVAAAILVSKEGKDNPSVVSIIIGSRDSFQGVLDTLGLKKVPSTPPRLS